MRHFPTLLLLACALLLGGLVTVQRITGNLDSVFGTPALKEGDLVYQFDPKNVGSIQIINDDGTHAHIKKIGNTWKLENPWEDLADTRLIQSVLNFSNTLVIEDIIERDEVEDLSEFGLQSARIEIKLFDLNGNSLCQYHLGRNTAWRSVDAEENNFPTVVIRPAEANQRDYLYVCADRADPKLRTVGIRRLFDQSLRLFRDHRAFYNHPLFASEVTLQENSSVISMSRANIAKGTPWQITKPFELAANNSAVNKLLQDLGNLQGVSVIDPSAVTLPAPTPENIDYTISANFSFSNQNSEPIFLYIYPPEKENSPTVFARVGQSPEKLRPAVLLLPRGPESPLAQLPKGVNQLRSRTLTSLSVKQLESLVIEDQNDHSLTLNLEWNPHERAKRWHAHAYDYSGQNHSKNKIYSGPANEEQVKATFEVLFQKSIVRFTDDAVTDLATYGLDQPIRKITLKLKDKKQITYQIGQRKEDHYFVREKGSTKAIAITSELFAALLRGKGGKQLAPLFDPKEKGLLVTKAAHFGFQNARVTRISTNKGPKTIELGRAKFPHFYASEKGSKRVTEIPAGFLTGLPVAGFRWRQTRLWNLNPFEVRGMIIDRPGKMNLTLGYNFFRQQWKAKDHRNGGQDLTARLNSNKANRLLEKLTELRILRWLGPNNPEAAARLEVPNLSISILTEEVNSDGETLSLTPQTLKISQINPGSQNDFFYGKSSSDPSYFLLDLATVQRLAVDLIE